MAEVSCLHLQIDDDDEDLTLDSAPYWSHEFDNSDVFADFPPSDLTPSITGARRRDPDRSRAMDEVSDPDSITAVVDFFDRENQANFVMDLIHQSVEQSSVGGSADLVSSDPNMDFSFEVTEEDDQMGSSQLELDLGLGLEFCMCKYGLADDDEGDDYHSGFMVADCGDEFFVSRRGSATESGESSTALSGGNSFTRGLRVVGVDSDGEENDNEVVGIDLNAEDDCALDDSCDVDTSLRLCWDSFQLEDHRDADEDFEWEEVDGSVDEREVLSMFFDADVDEDLDVSVSTVFPSTEHMGSERSGEMRNSEWEVLLNVHNFGMNVDPERDEVNYTAEYEMLFGQFAEDENAMVGRPPASKTVVENLQSVVLTQEDVDNDNALCAVCKDGISIGEQAKQLPCSHRYHGDCIVPWLGIRNTCPVCRYELPTDDPDYERRRAQRASRVH